MVFPLPVLRILAESARPRPLFSFLQPASRRHIPPGFRFLLSRDTARGCIVCFFVLPLLLFVLTFQPPAVDSVKKSSCVCEPSSTSVPSPAAHLA